MIIPKIKILKPGASENSTDIRDYRFHSNFSFLKGYLDTTESMTINAGDTTKQIIIPHGLTYAPEVDVFHDTGSGLVQLPYRLKTISGFDKHFYCSVDETNVYINWKSAIPYGEERYNADQIYHELDTGSANVLVGNASGNGYSSAVRFPNIALIRNQSIVSARIEWGNQISGPTNSDTLMKIFGLDYDNVGDVHTGMDRTDAYINQSQAKLSGTFGFNSNVKTMLEEIIARAGWSSGNRMGFTIENNGSPSDAYVGGSNSSTAELVVVSTGSTTLNFRIFINKDKIA